MQEIINYIISGIIMIATPIIFTRIVLNKKIQGNKIKLLIICAISIILYVLSVIYLNGTIKSLILFIINILILIYIFDIKIGKSAFITFLYAIVLMIPDMIVTITMTEIIDVDKAYYYNEFAGSILSNLIVCVGLIIVTLLLKNPLRKLSNYKLEENKKIVLISVLSLICSIIFFYEAFTNIIVNQELFVSIGIIAIFLIVLFSLFKQKIDNNNLTIEYDKLLDFMKKYEREIENQRILRHETKNQILTIKGKILEESKTSSLLDYINGILNDHKLEFNQEKYAKYQYLPANGIKALFYFKTEEAEELGVKVAINISSKIEKSFLGELDINNFKELGKIIGVYLDNAIEASSLSNDKILGIEIYKIDDDIQLIISNSYIGNIDNKKIGKSVFSTKGKNRGHGLLLVKSIIESNKMFQPDTEVTNKLYIQKLIIKKPI